MSVQPPRSAVEATTAVPSAVAPHVGLARAAVGLARRNVAEGVGIVERLDLTGVVGVAALIEHGVRVEQIGRRITLGQRRAHTPAWRAQGAGHAVVLLNGWTLSGRVWPTAFVDRLADTVRVVTTDNRGTGDDRGAPAPFTIADLADDVAGVVDAAGLGRATLVGFSLGGMIAIEAALRHPGLVGSLVLVSSRPPNPAQHRGRPTVGRALRAPDRRRDLADQLVERWTSVAGADFADRHPERLDEMAASAVAARTPWRTVLTQSRAAAAWHGPHRLRRIDVPTLVVHGLDDRLSPPDNGRSLAALIDGAEWAELAGTGHLVPQEAPDALADLVLDHVGRIHA